MTFQESEYWDQIGRVWKDDHPDGLWRAHSDAVNTELMKKWLPADRVSYLLKTDSFDEACSQGLFKLLSTRAQNFVEIDISPATLVAARHQHPELVCTVADVRSLPFRAGCFDVVVSNSTLDHFPSLAELESSIQELHRVLRSGGELILTLDNPLNPIVALRNFLPFKFLNRIGIVPYFVGATSGPKRLRQMLDKAGFDVVELGAVMHCPRVIAVALSRFLQRDTPSSSRFLSCMIAFERLGRWPTRFFTGYFVAAKAVKRSN